MSRINTIQQQVTGNTALPLKKTCKVHWHFNLWARKQIDDLLSFLKVRQPQYIFHEKT